MQHRKCISFGMSCMTVLIDIFLINDHVPRQFKHGIFIKDVERFTFRLVITLDDVNLD